MLIAGGSLRLFGNDLRNCRLELNVRANLDLPRTIAKGCICCPERGVLDSERPGGFACIPAYPGRMIECVQEDALNLQVDRRLDRNEFGERQIRIEVGWIM